MIALPFHDAISEPCQGHECDNCATCQRGRCCRRDHAGYQLPAEGTWPEPIYGELGVLESDKRRVQCHVCGEWYKSLGTHIWLKHNLTGGEYRAIFGLGYTERLASIDTRALMQTPQQIAHLKRVRTIRSFSEFLTAEQMTEIKSRPRRTGVRKKLRDSRKLNNHVDVMHTPEVWQKIGDLKRGIYAPHLHHANEERKARRIQMPCSVCGTMITRIPSQAYKPNGITCSPECHSQFLARNTAARYTERCGRGHVWTPESTYRRPDGTRTCKICKRLSTAKSAARHKERIDGGYILSLASS